MFLETDAPAERREERWRSRAIQRARRWHHASDWSRAATGPSAMESEGGRSSPPASTESWEQERT